MQRFEHRRIARRVPAPAREGGAGAGPDSGYAARPTADPASSLTGSLAKKRLLRKAVAPLVPSQVARGRKQGFSIPAAAWLRGDLEPFAREVLSPAAVARQGFLRPEAVTRLIDAHVGRKEDLSRQLWGLLAFTLWFERYGVQAENRASARINK